jgi:hypothetical protein
MNNRKQKHMATGRATAKEKKQGHTHEPHETKADGTKVGNNS